jgi:hypothetical protein
MSAATANRRELRRALLDEIVRLQIQCQACPDAEVRDALAQARDALRAFDAESLRLFKWQNQSGNQSRTFARRRMNKHDDGGRA